MVKKACALILSALVTVGTLSGCEIDVNKLVSGSDEEGTGSYSSYDDTENTSFDEETNPDIDFYEQETESETASETETMNNTSFDTSAYKVMYVTGAGEIDVMEDANVGSRVIGTLSCGDSVSFINSVAADKESDESKLIFIYSETLGTFGYVKNINLVDIQSEVSYGEIYYVKSNESPLYTDQYGSAIIRLLSKNDMVTVLAKTTNGLWRVSDKSGKLGYVSVSLLSEEKISNKFNSSRYSSKSESKTVSKEESQTESRIESKTESRTASKAEPSVKIGAGEPPVSGYSVYVVDVDLGYLALRGEPSSDTDEILGELYYEEQVYVIDSSGSFWYIYAPTLGMYGYVNGDYDYLYPAY